MVYPDERRYVTVLFADLSDFTSLSERLDPEEVTALVNRYFEAISGVVDRYGGTVNNLLGDAALVLFGAPVAHEDDPERAVRAALEMMESTEDINRDSPTPVAMHIGIDTGLVVAGSVGAAQKGQYTVIGDAVNTAARIQGAASPGQILVGQSVYHLTRDAFEYRSVGRLKFKGKSGLVPVYEPRRALPRRSRLQIAQHEGLSQFVGRTDELAELASLFATAVSGKAQAVGVVGEAGNGKSRLLYEFRRTLPEGVLYLEGTCVPYGGTSAYQPLIGMLRRHWDLPEEVGEEVGQRLVQRTEGLEEYLPVFEDLLSLSPRDRDYLQLTPQQRKAKMFNGLEAFYQRTAASQPLVIAFDDLQWVDQTSREFLTTQLDALAGFPVLLMFLSRPEFDPPWIDHPSYRELTLAPLPTSDSHLLVRSLLDLPPTDELEDYVLGRSEGNPFFTEELLRALKESGALSRNGNYALAVPAHELTIPDTLQGVIAARIDRLDSRARNVLQVASVIGRQFQLLLLREVLARDPQLEYHLEQLMKAQFVYADDSDRTTFAFSHALTQEVAYDTPLRSAQRETHRQVAEALLQLSPHTADTQPEILAHHYTEGHLSEKAIPYWQRAAQKAIQRSANHEAISHVRQALQLLEQLPSTDQLVEQELTLQTTLGAALMATHGFASSAVEQTYARARRLSDHLEGAPQLFPVLFGLWRFYLMRAEFETARQLARQLVAIAGDDAGLSVEAHFSAAAVMFWRGELEEARQHFERVVADYPPDAHQEHVYTYGQDPLSVVLPYYSWNVLLMGYADQSLQLTTRSFDHAARLDHAFGNAYTLVGAAMLHQMRQEPQQTTRYAEQALALSEDMGFPYFVGVSKMLLGWASARGGNTAAGVDRIIEGLGDWSATGSELGKTYYLLMLTDAYRADGNVAEGLATMERAIATAINTGEHLWEPELYRLRAELLLLGHDEVGADTAFRRAIRVARAHKAKLLEIRSLNRLTATLVSIGGGTEELEALAHQYDWFAEGWDISDLKEARALRDGN